MEPTASGRNSAPRLLRHDSQSEIISIAGFVVGLKGVAMRGKRGAVGKVRERACNRRSSGEEYRIHSGPGKPASTLPDGLVFTSEDNTFQVDYEGGDGNDLTLTRIP